MTSRCVTLSDHLALAAKPADKEYQVHDRSLAGLMLRVQPTGAKSWVFRRRVNGRQKRVALGSADTIPVAEVRAKAHAYLAADTTFETLSQPKGPTFAEMARIYTTRRAAQWKSSTRYTHACYLNSTLLPFFADMPIDKITRADVTRWFHEYGRTRPGGANRAVDMLRDLFYRARDWGLLDEAAPNPAKGIKKNRQTPKGRLLNDKQLQRLGAVLDRYAVVHPDTTDAIRLLLLTGCRAGEILNLSWKEVKVDQLKLADSKTGPRDVILGKPAILLLRRHHSGDHVFPSPILPNRPRSTVIPLWHRVRREADLGAFRLHDLRHTFASYAIMRGEGLLMAGKLLGHRHTSSTERYAHLDGRFLLDAAERIGQEIMHCCQAA